MGHADHRIPYTTSLFVGMLLCLEIGRRLGCSYRSRCTATYSRRLDAIP
jgi:hypothetical protein